MFPDTAQFTDPAYTGIYDPLDPSGGVYDNTTQVPGTGPSLPGIPFLPASGDFEPSTYSAGDTLIPPSTGGASSNTPAQSNQTGAGLLGWLGLGQKIAQTATSAAKTGATTRPGVATKLTSTLGSFGAITTTTLLVIVAVFVGVLFLLKK